MILIKRIIVIVLLSLAFIASFIAIYMLYSQSEKQQEQIEVLTQQLITSQNEDLVQVVVAQYPVRNGKIDSTNFTYANWSRASVSPNMITDISLLDGKLLKIDLSQGSPITSDMIATQEYGATDRMQLALVDAVSPSLEVGDYIDLRMVTPYGINYVVMPKKRVEAIYENGIEFIMSEAEQMIYSGLLIDQFMNPGTVVYTSKYLDPTIQKSNYAMYVPPNEVLNYMSVNANMLYPYLSTDNVVGLRAYIESTQPWMLYGPSTFQTETQSVMDRQQKITSGVRALTDAMGRARSEYEANQAMQQNNTGSAPAVQEEDLNAPAVINEDGTYVDGNGVTRDADGNIVLSPGDILGGE